MNDNPLSSRERPARDLTGRMAEPLRPVSAPVQGFKQLSGMRKSTRLGILIFLQHSPSFELSEYQLNWILHHSSKFSEAELFRASSFAEKLLSDETLQRRMQSEILNTFRSVPRLVPQRIAEKRRIGIGYRDKGALRPLHKIKSEVNIYWDEDIRHLLPFPEYVVTGQWLTAEEVIRLTGIDHLSLAMQVTRRFTTDDLATFPKFSHEP